MSIFKFFVAASLAVGAIGASHSHSYPHQALHGIGRLPQGVVLDDVDSSHVLLASRSNVSVEDQREDLHSVVDRVVEEWIQTNPKYSSQDELAKLLGFANSVKESYSAPLKKKSTEKRESTTNLSGNQTPSFSRRGLNATSLSNSTLEQAREMVRLAQEEANKRNVERLNNPRLNHYYTKETANSEARKRALEANLLPIDETLAAAAAMVAEADAAAAGELPSAARIHSNNKKRATQKRASTFWMEGIEHSGQWPFGGSDNDGYKVFRNVKDYGAVGDGRTDDTAAINKAMAETNRCGPNCGSSSVKGAIIYFPPGTYLISSPIEAYYNTQLIGDANDPPILLAAPSFIGLGLISIDKYTGENNGAGQWFINQSNFLRQVRNFYIDLTNADMYDIAGIHWQAAQATSLQDIVFFGSTAADKSHMGIFAENGSGGFMSDLTFNGGALGIRCGNQQFTTRNFVFFDVKIAIDLLWDWGWTWKSLDIYGASFGIKMSGTDLGGSILVLDSRMTNVGVGIWVDSPKAADQEHFSITIDNLVMADVSVAVSDATTGAILEGGTKTVTSWTQGKVYDENNKSGAYQAGGSLSSIRPQTASLLGGPNGGYFERSKPQYKDLTWGDFLIATNTAKGDGSTDDTDALNFMFAVGSGTGIPVYIPAGSYIVTNTVLVEVGTKIVGECWAQIVAKGDKFSDMDNPRVMIQVGNAGDSGVVEIQDLMFTNVGPTAGVILMEWNVAESTPGSAAMWDSHFRIGGARGTGLQAADCPKLTGAVNPKCIAGSMLLHMTAESTGYLENVWAWVADHDLDSNVAQTQIDIYVARGILIESRGSTWLYGTAAEHCVLYQYQLFNAKDIFMGMIQTESPYYLPNPQAPEPFTSAVGLFESDPTFDGCDASNEHCKAAWGLRLISSENIHILGAGLYNWFQSYIQPCVDTQDCQQRVVDISGSSAVWFYNLYTIGTVEMLNARGNDPIVAKDNTNMPSHPFTSIVNAWLLSSSDSSAEDEGWEDPIPCTATYTNIDDVIAATANIPYNCLDQYILDAEIATLDKALTTYVDTINNNYDEKFQIYANQIRRLVPQQLKSWMSGAQESGFFTCKETYTAVCCSDCSSGFGGCSTCDNSDDCQSGERTRDVDCPTLIPTGTGLDSQPTIAYTLVDEAGFDQAMQDTYGIDPSWIIFDDLTVRVHPGCAYAQEDVEECMQKYNTFWSGFPMAGTIDVTDPKDLIAPSYDNTVGLAALLHSAREFAEAGLEFATFDDIVDAATITVLLTDSAVTSMGDVVEAADEISAQERQETIFNFVMAFLMLIPVAGEIADAALLTTLGTIIRTLGNLADIAFTVYDFVQSPKDGAWILLDLLTHATHSKSSKGLAEAGAARRGMSNKDLDGLTPVRGKMDQIETCRTTCWSK